MRFIYNLVWPLGLLVFLPGYILKMIRRGGYRNKFGQRLGLYDVDLQAKLGKERSTWLHAVSVGEVAVALKLASQLRALEPNLACVLTTTTTTGFAFAIKNAPDWIEVMYTRSIFGRSCGVRSTSSGRQESFSLKPRFGPISLHRLTLNKSRSRS